MSALMVNGLYPARTSEFVHVAKIAQQEVRVMIRCGQYRRVPIANICCSFAIPNGNHVRSQTSRPQSADLM
jgi:hypothetical protein